MLQPKRVKYRNHHRGRRKGLAVAGSTMNFGEFGIKATEAAWVDIAADRSCEARDDALCAQGRQDMDSRVSGQVGYGARGQKRGWAAARARLTTG